MSQIFAESEISLSDPDFVHNPHAVQATLREQTPVYRAIAPNGAPVWVVTRYVDARAAFAHPHLSKDAVGLRRVLAARLPDAAANISWTRLIQPHMLHSDPPDHTRLRRLLGKAFTARQVERIRPRIAAHTEELLDRLARRAEFDLLAEFSVPLTLRVICELIGVPSTNQQDFLSWCATYAAGGTPEKTESAIVRITGYLAERLVSVRVAPKDDLLSELVRARDDGDRLTEQELLATVFLLLVAGHETTANLIGNGTLALLLQPGSWEGLRADRSAVPAAIEELLRFDGPGLMASLRFSTHPVDIGGQVIPAGEIVLIGLSAANRDPRQFADPDRLDLMRDTRGHLGFGHGVHFCVGAALARVEAQIAFDGLLTRFPHLSLAVDVQELRWRPSLLFRGLETLPLKAQQ